MDFYKIAERSTTRGRDKEIVSIDIYPDFIVRRSKDLMIRGKSFYAIWNDETGMWSKDEYDVSKLIDQDMYGYVDIMKKNVKLQDVPVKVMSMASFRSNTWKNYRQYINMMADNYHELDEHLTFLNTEVKKEDYVSKRLDYALEEGSYDAWDKLVGTLYEPAEREKIEWSIGSIVSGDSRTIQKFCVFYGAAGTGKSTIIKIIQRLFRGYCETFDAKSLASASSQFAMEVFRSNPLVAIQHDGDLSRIEDNTKLNSIVSHEPMIINEKGKPQYTLTPSCFLFMGTNRPVKITEAKSGIKRRLIDIVPSGRKLPSNEYNVLMSQVEFELGAIAQHCLDIYRELGKHYYDKYEPTEMMVRTNAFYNFVSSEEFQDALEGTDGMTLKQAYALYKQHCEDTLIHQMPRYIFKEELKNYFKNFEDLATVGDKKTRSWYSGFLYDELEPPVLEREVKPLPMSLDCTTSLLDDILADYPAQYATEDEREKPVTSWERCKTATKDLDTGKLHYILPWKLGEERDPERSLVWIDFDLKNEKGEKDALLNMEAASKWPTTYSEYSKGGAGIHNYYWYTGDISQVATVYAPGIEIKLPIGYSSIRRRLSKCNNIPIATLNTGALPLKEEKVIDVHELKDVQHLRNKIKRALRKGDNVGGTKCEIDLIKKTLDDAYASGMSYDVSDMEHDILMFAMQSTNNAQHCVQQLNVMKLRSKDIEAMKERERSGKEKEPSEDTPLTFFDIEIYPPGIDEDGNENEGLFLVCWKYAGENEPVHALTNPKSHEIEPLFEMKLVGFNNRDYDNHMLYARYLGYSNAKMYDLSRRLIVEHARDAKFPEAYDISYTDVFDFCSKKQGLKKWEIELDIDHVEMSIPWDKPAPKRMWPDIIKYCSNDVIATEAVFNANKGDFVARQILADLAGGKVNDTTNQLTTRFIFQGNKHPRLIYTDLATGEQY